MRKAMENVEKHYAVVGVLEDLNKTLTVLEHYIPRFFKGAKDVYYSKCVISTRNIFHIPNFFLRPDPEVFQDQQEHLQAPGV